MADASLMDLWQVENALTGSFEITCVKKQPCSSNLLARIQQGMLDSKKALNDLEACCRTWRVSD